MKTEAAPRQSSSSSPPAFDPVIVPPVGVFRTREELEHRKGDSLHSYFRSHAPDCRLILHQGLDPTRLKHIRAIFPFFRAISVLRIPLNRDWFPLLLTSAFYAGIRYGETCAVDASDLVLGYGSYKNTLHALEALTEAAGGDPSPGNIRGAYQKIVDHHEPREDQTYAEYVLELLTRTIFVGIAASTSALFHPPVSDFCDHVAAYPRRHDVPLLQRVLEPTLVHAVNTPATLLQHPLLSVADAHYISTPTEREVINRFLRRQLQLLHVSSETECPSSELDLIRWVAEAVEFGQRIRRHRPGQIRTIFTETGHSKVEDLREQAAPILRGTDGLKARRVLKQLLEWHDATYGWSEPRCYAEELIRTLRIADYSIWLAWLR